MALNLITLIAVPVMIVAGVLLLRRSLKGASIGAVSARGKQCIACGAPAEEFSTFECPACGRDAREQGLWEPGASRAPRPFWRVMVLSFLMIPVGLLLFVLMASLAPSQNNFESETTLTPIEPAGYEEIEITARGSRVSESPVQGMVTADVFLKDGGMISFEVRAPSMETAVKGSAGETLGRGTLSAALLNRWLPADAPTTDGDLIWWEINRMLFRISSAPITSRRFSSSGGSSGTSSGPPAWIAPAALLATSTIWLLLTFRFTRGAVKRGRS